ncbi:MinD/ParA family ATP-binding protein [Mycobacterium xenopi]|uniref:MinD/ParA family ATP-binding protein n=1 Tax=Mycobacterium xenopi TaxID=1789 RepID=UPI000A14A725|nr:MinD/ParA family protein [Mycobacterium xenopi]ORX21131.1 hypothetical protein AWC32_02065 [Mycobacterium xenopi]SPX94837.1 chromosome partitioning ATPase [Mycobacterium xenopi]
MSTPSDFPQGDGPRHEQRSPQQRDAPGSAAPPEQRNAPGPAPHGCPPRPPQAGEGAPASRVRWSPPPSQPGPGPVDERRRQPAPPSGGPGPQPPTGGPHPGSGQRPQFSWPDPLPRPNPAPAEPATERHTPGAETPDDGRTAVLPPDELAAIRNKAGDDQGLGDFFTDAPPAEGQLPAGWAPASPGPAAPPQQVFSGGYGAPEDTGRIVTTRRRPSGTGWRKLVSQVSFGLINPGPSAKQEQAEELLRRIKAALLDVYVVAFVNAKGGVGKTTMTVATGNAIARERGDRVIAVDVDTDLGNLSSRFEQQGGPKANIEALSSLQDASSYPTVRVFTVQNDDRLEMLAAQNDPRSSYILNSQDFESTMKILRLHYNVILLDCGTAITSPLFSTIAQHVDALVVVASQDPPGLNGAWATLQWLQSHGFGRLLPRTVVALNASFKGKPLVDIDAAETQFREKIQGINVVRVPYDVHLAEGGNIAFTELKPRTRKSLMNLAGAVAAHYPRREPYQQRSNETGRF